jgi:hypothetical protein
MHQRTLMTCRHIAVLILVLAPLPAFSQSGKGQPPRDVNVKGLLKSSADNDPAHESQFFRTLKDLIRRQGRDPSQYTQYDPGVTAPTGRTQAALNSGTALNLPIPDATRVLVILGRSATSIPDLSVQQLLLLDGDGSILDLIACSINSRYGRVLTEVRETSDKDGARLVIRFEPKARAHVWHNWHTITYRSKSYSFYAKERDEPTNWSQSGLLRIAVDRDSFRVVFTALKHPDGTPSDPPNKQKDSK